VVEGTSPIDLRKAVVDTGPLFNALMLVFVRSSPTHSYAPQRNALSDYLRDNPTKQRVFLELFNSIKSVLITSHVIGELTGLHKRAKLPSEEFWRSSMEYMRWKNVDERLLRLIEMHNSEEMRETLCLIGPTDAGLIELARRESCVLLTDDERTLATQSWRLGIECHLIRNLL